MLDILLQDASLRSRLEVVELKGSQRALVWKDGRLACVVGGGRHAFWKRPAALEIELRDVSEMPIMHPRMAQIIRHADACTLFSVVNVAADEELLLFRDGVLIERLGPGPHVFWQSDGFVRWKVAARSEEAAIEHRRVARVEISAEKDLAERLKRERSA
jgi:hypothetical protein